MRNRKRVPKVSPATAARLDHRDWMEARYETDRLSAARIEAMLGSSDHTVRRALVDHGITMRPERQRSAGAAKRLADPVWLRDRCISDGIGIREIGELLKTNPRAVSAALSEFGISRRPGRTDRTPPELRDEACLRVVYATKSMAQIAEELDVAKSSIVSA